MDVPIYVMCDRLYYICL